MAPVTPVCPVEPVLPVAPTDPVAPGAPVAPVLPTDPVEPVYPVRPCIPIGPTKVTFELVVQDTGVTRLVGVHDTMNPDGSIPVTITYPAPDERVRVHCTGLNSGAVAVLDPADPNHR